jgi:hypothetical protein
MIKQYLPNKTKVVLFIELKKIQSKRGPDLRPRGHRQIDGFACTHRRTQVRGRGSIPGRSRCTHSAVLDRLRCIAPSRGHVLSFSARCGAPVGRCVPVACGLCTWRRRAPSAYAHMDWNRVQSYVRTDEGRQVAMTTHSCSVPVSSLSSRYSRRPTTHSCPQNQSLQCSTHPRRCRRTPLLHTTLFWPPARAGHHPS